jgi:cytochrome c5
MSLTTTQHQGPRARALIPALALLMLMAAGCSEKEATAPQEVAPEQETAMQPATPEAAPPAEAPEPVAPEPAEAPEPVAAEPAETQAAAADGEQIYKASCHACHAAGVAGAPKLGDKEAWAPRIAKGNDALLSSVKNGLNAMPPKGACMTCSDDDLGAAVQYMVEQGS